MNRPSRFRIAADVIECLASADRDSVGAYAVHISRGMTRSRADGYETLRTRHGVRVHAEATATNYFAVLEAPAQVRDGQYVLQRCLHVGTVTTSGNMKYADAIAELRTCARELAGALTAAAREA